MESWLLAALFGAVYGLAELTPRYRDAPVQALRSAAASLYVGINAIASLAALWIVRVMSIDFGLPEGTGREVSQVLLAGFAAMSIFRSSLLIRRVGDEDVAAGPLRALEAVLEASDRGVDRQRARSRASEVRDVMDGVSLEQARSELPVLVFNLMQNVTRQERIQLAAEVGEIKESDLSDQTQVYAIGLALMHLTGRAALQAAVQLLASSESPSDEDVGESDKARRRAP